MSPDVFRYFPIVIAGLYLLAALVLIVGGAMALRRGQGGAIKTISTVAIFAGVILVLVLGMSIAFNVRIFASLPFLFFLVAAISFVVWIAALMDCAMNEPSQGNDKLVWVIIIVFTNVVGAVIYLLARRPRRIAESGR